LRSIWTLLSPTARRSWNIKTLPRLVVVILVVSLAAAFVSRPSRAELCAVDPVPAATLLLPYFELGLKDISGKKSKGENTILYVHNTEAAPFIARVTLWTELSVPTLAFSFGRRDVLVLGDGEWGGTRREFTALSSTGLSGDGCAGRHVRISDLDGDGRGEIVASFGEDPGVDPACGAVGSLRAWLLAARSRPIGR